MDPTTPELTHTGSVTACAEATEERVEGEAHHAEDAATLMEVTAAYAVPV